MLSKEQMLLHKTLFFLGKWEEHFREEDIYFLSPNTLRHLTIAAIKKKKRRTKKQQEQLSFSLTAPMLAIQTTLICRRGSWHTQYSLKVSEHPHYLLK